MTEDEIILTHILQCRLIDLLPKRSALSFAQQKQFETYKRRRRAGEPLQYILGTCNFMGLELAVNPSVLIPRPETEQLVDAALKHLALSFPNVPPLDGIPPKAATSIGNPIQILDLGTGSGNIAIALAKFVPQSQIVSVEVSAQVLKTAKINARQHGVEERIKFVCSDMFVILSEAKDLKMFLDSSASPQNDNGLFDLIISNPPYIPTSQLSGLPRDVQKEPRMALDGGEDGLDFYRIIIKYTPHLLRDGACLMMEFGDGQAEAVKKLVEAQKVFSSVEIIQDLAGRDRIILVKTLA
jgi:release factor glutamine methyltransferase